MDDEKKWSGDEPQKDTAPPEATKPSVRYEENDNWEFEAQAPTLDDNFLADDQFEIQMPAEKPRPAESEPAAPAANSGEKAGHCAYGTLEDRSVLSAVCSRGGCIGCAGCALLHRA